MGLSSSQRHAFNVNLLEDKYVSEKITYSSFVAEITHYILKTDDQ